MNLPNLEINFIYNEARYQYGFLATTKERELPEEWLIVIQNKDLKTGLLELTMKKRKSTNGSLEIN